MEEINISKPYALVFGNEANGITNDLKEVLIGESVHIDICNVESLNLSIASSIAMYKFK